MSDTDRQDEFQDTESSGNLAGRIEALLFVSGEALDTVELARALNVTQEEMNSALNQMRDEYDFAQRGFYLKRFGSKVQLTTREIYSADIVNLLQPVQKQSLSRAAVETLAIVAYRQPVTKGEIEQIRGVKCDYTVQSLVNKDMIKEVGRKETLGRPILYGTTDEFLNHFGIESLEELPPIPEEKPEESAEKTISA